MTSDPRAGLLRRAGLELAGPLGSGGDGVRWAALDADGRRWAVTILAGPTAGEVARLRRRVAGLAAVAHPHLAGVGPLVELADGAVAVLHEEIAGTDLATVCAGRGPWSPGEVVTVVVPLAEALAALHDAGLAHGDVAPGNVVLRPDGRAVLVDVVCADGPRERGTPGMAAPERAGGATPAADVHALGRLGLLLVTGREPGDGEPGDGEPGDGEPGDAVPGDRAPGDAVPGVDPAAETPAVGPMPVGPGSASVARARLLRVLNGAAADDPVRRPGARRLAAQVYAACPPTAVGVPDAAVLARLALRRLAEPTEDVRTARTSAGRGRHRRAQARRRWVPVVAAALALGVCVATATVAGNVVSVPEPVPAALAGPTGSGTGGRDPVVGAVRLTWARALALASGDRVALSTVTVAGSPAAAGDRAVAQRLWLGGAAGGAGPGEVSAQVRVVVEQVLRLGRGTSAQAARCGGCVRVLLAARASSGGPGDEPTEPGPAEPDQTGPGTTASITPVVLVMRPTRSGWRVSEVEAYRP